MHGEGNLIGDSGVRRIVYPDESPIKEFTLQLLYGFVVKTSNRDQNEKAAAVL